MPREDIHIHVHLPGLDQIMSALDDLKTDLAAHGVAVNRAAAAVDALQDAVTALEAAVGDNPELVAIAATVREQTNVLDASLDPNQPNPPEEG